MLLLQVSFPCALFSPTHCQFVLRGGTNAAMAPQVDYATMVFGPMLKRFGGDLNLTVNKRGYFPRGGGEVVVDVFPVEQLNAVDITARGRVVRVVGRMFVAGSLPLGIAHEMSKVATKLLQRRLGPDVKLEMEVVKEKSAVGAGSGLMLVAETDTGCLLAGSALGQKKVKPAAVATEAAEMLIENVEAGGCVDEYLADQLVIFMALAVGVISS